MYPSDSLTRANQGHQGQKTSLRKIKKRPVILENFPIVEPILSLFLLDELASKVINCMMPPKMFYISAI